tara:strand:- start:379 stop:519 length:141 start_codon:yes stop_codon:yes gene_type:complete
MVFNYLFPPLNIFTSLGALISILAGEFTHVIVISVSWILGETIKVT